MRLSNKILIIEDDNTTCSTLSRILSQNGYDVSSCTLLREAEALLDTQPFDLIVSDVGLPDGNGIVFCSQYQYIPFIAMSALEDNRDFAMSHNAKDFIEKPFTIDDMLATVRNII